LTANPTAEAVAQGASAQERRPGAESAASLPTSGATWSEIVVHEAGIQDGAHLSSVPIVRAVPGRAMKVVMPALITKGVERIGEGMMEIIQTF
jgi:hypothetical protein